MRDVILACDIGGSKLLCGLVLADGTVIDQEKVDLMPQTDADKLETVIFLTVKKLTDRNSDCFIFKCGVTIPGVADAKTGMWVYACFSGISDYPIAERLKKVLKCEVFIANDVNACAWGEKIFGCCKDCDDYLWVTVSNGIGGGLMLSGKIYEGAFSAAGELGHIVVEKDGALCPCGHHGCTEALAAGPAVSRRYKELTDKELTAQQIAELARNGENNAILVYRQTGRYIGTALGKVASVLNLKRYVLGGGVMQSFDLMEPDIVAAFIKEAFEVPNRGAEIVKTALGYNAGLLGAAAIALYPIYEQ